MPKTCTELTRHVLNGPTMGTRWSATCELPAESASPTLHAALHAALPQHQRLHGAVSALPHALDAGFQRQGYLGLL